MKRGHILEEQADILKFLGVINKRKTIIILGALVCLLSAIIVTVRMSPVYEASVQVLVSQRQATGNDRSSGESYQAVLLSERLAKTFSQMIISRTLAEKVIEKLELPLLPEDLQQKITAEPVKDTQLILLTISDSNPVRTKNLANTYAVELIKMTEKVASLSESIDVSIVEQAVVPLKPVKPKPLSNAILALLVGLIASTGLAFLLEMLDDTVKELDEIEQLVTLPSLGRIPYVSDPSLLDDNSSMISEAYRSLRTNLQYLNFDQSIRTLVVASAGAGEGKTTISSNLSIVLAQAGLKVLIIDCDLRKPSLGGIFCKPASAGLSNVLAGALRPHSVMLATNIEGLRVITSGPIPPNPADLLNSDRMDALLADLRDEFDLIILDSPPILTMADTAILGAKANAVLLITSLGKTKKSELVPAKDALDKVGARVIGFVISNTKIANKSGYYHYDGSYSQRATARKKNRLIAKIRGNKQVEHDYLIAKVSVGDYEKEKSNVTA